MSKSDSLKNFLISTPIGYVSKCDFLSPVLFFYS
ncbi:Uncharacterised protein [Enterobacter cancerogenus]|uniref:Uncharacterized protein n=1 Tax=Enterobacter cancerogenus TaxID=69218 RepID=A0A484YJI5_9ENTR|nr:Uncharacterised protein [Enterobacter cancerogenus]